MQNLIYRLLLLLMLFSFSCSKSEKQEAKKQAKVEIPNKGDNPKLQSTTIFNEPNLSTDYSDIDVFVGEVYSNEGFYFVDVKVETQRENYHIEMVGNLSDEKGNIRGARVDAFYGPAGFEYTYAFEKIEGFSPHLLLLSIYNPIDGNWNDLKFRYF